jgi:hypothetical protein
VNDPEVASAHGPGADGPPRRTSRGVWSTHLERYPTIGRVHTARDAAASRRGERRGLGFLGGDRALATTSGRHHGQAIRIDSSEVDDCLILGPPPGSVKARRRVLATRGRSTQKERLPRIEKVAGLPRSRRGIEEGLRRPRHRRVVAGDLVQRWVALPEPVPLWIGERHGPRALREPLVRFELMHDEPEEPGHPLRRIALLTPGGRPCDGPVPAAFFTPTTAGAPLPYSPAYETSTDRTSPRAGPDSRPSTGRRSSSSGTSRCEGVPVEHDLRSHASVGSEGA